MDESTGKGVYHDNLFIHFPGIVDGCLCAASGDFPTYRQKNVRMIDHKFVAFHHTFFVVISADIDNRIRLLQNRVVKYF